MMHCFFRHTALLGAVAAFCLLTAAPQAEARLGTGIGVTLPMGGSSDGSTTNEAVESYAAVTEGHCRERRRPRRRECKGNFD